VPIDLSHFVGGLLLLGIEWRDRRWNQRLSRSCVSL